VATTWQFVADMASTSPTVLLDLNNGNPFWVGDNYQVSPPSYDKSRAGGALQHGQSVTRSVANNRTITLPLVLTAATPDAAATAIQNLGNQLRVDNILKIQIGTTNPVFFRTFADPEYVHDVVKHLVQYSKITLEIEAEPFAYSPRVEVTGSPFTVSNDPALSTGLKFDITGILGDVPSPLLLVSTSTGASGAPSGLVNKWTHIATRRRGTPSNYSNVIQAENMLPSTDTATSVDGTMSGGNKMRCTFATNTALTVRLSDSFPDNGTATVEARGEYRVYAKVAKTVAGDVINVQFRYGTGVVNHVTNDVVGLPAVAGPMLVDLGKIPVPSYSDPGQLGFSGSQLKALTSWVALYAQRVSGSGSLDIDYLYFMPADDQTLIVKFPNTDATYAIDGTTDAGGSVYSLNTALDTVQNIAFPPQIVGGGGFPEVMPGQTNRVHVIRNVDPAGTVDALTDTTTYRAYYWPRWREFVRP
jgi:hypothetical protein